MNETRCAVMLLTDVMAEAPPPTWQRPQLSEDPGEGPEWQKTWISIVTACEGVQNHS